MNFITGNNFKHIANYILDEFGFRHNKHTEDNPTYFVKTDYIHEFFNSPLLPNITFSLITHNSDHDINHSHAEYLGYNFLNRWFAQNVNYEHQKLIPIPIGVANPEWPHGNISILKAVIKENNIKKNIAYANFNIRTNHQQREYCLNNIPEKIVEIENNVDFYTYLKHTSQAYFSICPLGNGIDSHRIWESLYLHTVPIVEMTHNIKWLTKKYNLPIIIIQDWAELSQMTLNASLYETMIKNFNVNCLSIDNFINI